MIRFCTYIYIAGTLYGYGVGKGNGWGLDYWISFILATFIVTASITLLGKYIYKLIRGNE